MLEPKELLKARIGISPDLADAYMQTHAIAEMPGDMAERLGMPSTSGRVLKDGDP